MLLREVSIRLVVSFYLMSLSLTIFRLVIKSKFGF